LSLGLIYMYCYKMKKKYHSQTSWKFQ
jgi:hypothetical protein